MGEQEENKVLRAQVELTQVRAEIERRIGEKEEEFQSTKKNFTKAVDGMQGALEQKSIKGLGGKIREIQTAYEDEQRAKEVTRDHLIAAERKAHSVLNALEEARTL